MSDEMLWALAIRDARIAELGKELEQTRHLLASLVGQNCRLIERNLALGDVPAPIDWTKGFTP